MTPWFMLIFVLIVSVTLFLWMNKKKNAEGFGDFFNNQYLFTDMQRTYYHDQANKEIITNLDMDVSSVNQALNQADMYLQTSPDRDFKVYFRSEDNKYTQQDEKMCRAAPHPRNLKRNPRTTTGCGWWYVADPGKPSCGALGTRQGPLFPEVLRSTYPGGRWVWDLKEAEKLEDIKMCKRITTCVAINAEGIKGNCAFCAEKGHAIPINADGSMKYPEDDVGGGCETGDMYKNADQCPRAEALAAEVDDEEVEYDLDGNPLPPTVGGGSPTLGTARAPGQRITTPPRDTCDPLFGKLTRECLRSLAKSMGMSDGGAVIRMISRMEAPNDLDKAALSYLKDVGVLVPEAVLGSGAVDRDTASSTYKKIVDSQNHGTLKVREGAKYLASGNENFDICYMDDKEEGPFPPECMVREFRKAGCQQSGKAAPIGSNASRYAGLTWGEMKGRFANLYKSMKSADPTTQDTAVSDCLGTGLYREPLELCDEPGIEYMVYSWDTWFKRPNMFMGRILSKEGFLRHKDGNGPWASRSALYSLMEKSGDLPYFKARTIVQPKAPGSLDLKGWTTTNAVTMRVNGEPSGATPLGKWDKLSEYQWSVPLSAGKPNLVEMQYQAITSDYTVPYQSNYVTENLNSLQLVRESWRPVIALDFFKNPTDESKLDANGAVVTSLPRWAGKAGGALGNKIGSRHVFTFLPQNNVGIQLTPIHADVLATMTFMMYVPEIIPKNSAIWNTGLGTQNAEIQVLTSGDGGVFFSINNYAGGQMTTAIARGVLKPKSWVHVAAVLHGDRKGVDLYVNGTKQTSARGDFAIPSVSMRPLMGNWGFEYPVAWFHIYDTYLTQPEIMRDMNYDNDNYVMTTPAVPRVSNRKFTYTLHPGKISGGYGTKVETYDRTDGDDANLDRCIDACGNDPKCVAFSMTAEGSKHRCFLRNTLTPFEPHNSTTQSGRIHRPYLISPGTKDNYLMDVSGVSKNDGATVYQWGNWDGPNQKWTMGENNTLTSVNSGKCLDVYGSRTDPGAQVIQFACHGSGNQRFEMDNQQRLHPQHAPTKCLEIDNNAYNGSQNGGRLFINECKMGEQNQKWNFRSADK